MSRIIKKRKGLLGKLYLNGILLTAITGLGLTNHSLANSFAVDGLVDQWVSIEAQRENIILDWAEKKQSLLQQIALLEAEHEALTKVAENNRLKIDQNREERLQLAQAQEDLEKEQLQMEKAVESAALKMLALQEILPPPLQNAWQFHARELNKSEISTSERLDHVLRLLKNFDSFNQRIVVSESIIHVPDKDGLHPVLVKQVYLGVSQGWFASEDGRYYGFGKAVKGKWHWYFQEEADQYLGETLSPSRILEVANITENPALAELVALPISISHEE